MDLGLKDKAVLVTAASRGLGKAAALAFAREGARVAICSHSHDIDAAAADIQRQTGADVFGIRADLTIAEDIEALVKTTLARLGQIEILVINAGGPPPGGFLALRPEDWEYAYRVTVMSAVRLCYAVIPHMLERGSGSIVASQSYSVKQPIENLVLSNSLRMAVIGLMKSLALELGPKGIRVNTINPGWTSTERLGDLIADRARRGGGTPEQEITKITAQIPLHRMGSVEEYGRAIAWLASPAASYIHGHALLIDGGITKTAL